MFQYSSINRIILFGWLVDRSRTNDEWKMKWKLYNKLASVLVIWLIDLVIEHYSKQHFHHFSNEKGVFVLFVVYRQSWWLMVIFGFDFEMINNYLRQGIFFHFILFEGKYLNNFCLSMQDVRKKELIEKKLFLSLLE